jgi:Fur family ferric uptake transcriptional regulator
MAGSAEEDALDILRTQGRRITAQRGLLLQVMRESHEHLDAGEIYRRARGKDPRISLSTVYRNLNLLKDLGVITELHLDEEHHHYELREEAEHYHLICSNCDRVVEFDSSSMGALIEQIGAEQGFLIEHVHIDLVGLCQECRAGSDA